MKPTKQEALDKLEELKQDFDKRARELQSIIKSADKPKTLKERLTEGGVEAAITELGEADPAVILYRRMQKADMPIKLLAEQRIKIWVKCVNEGFVFDWHNAPQYKYLPWFDMRKEVGKGFFHSDYDFWLYYSDGVPADHFYKSKEDALWSGQLLEQEYYNYMK